MADFVKLREQIELWRKQYNVAGISVAVTDRKKTLFAEGFGTESVERPVLAVTRDTRFKIASISKMITAITCMRLADRGLLDLDAPIKTYVPWLRLSRREAEETMTLRHLLCHGSGLSGELRKDGVRDERYLEASLREMLPELKMFSLPGEGAFLYSNYGFVLASCIAQQVTGEIYSQLARHLVTEPLGMHCTHYHFNEIATYPWALPHREKEDDTLYVEHRVSSVESRFGSGEVFSTPTDLCILARFLMNGGITDSGERLLSEKSVREMLTPQILRDDGDHHGLGIHIRNFEGICLYGHTGWLPPYRASVFFDDDRGVGIAVALNTDKPDIRDDIMRVILNEGDQL